MARYEFYLRDGSSDKFWSIEPDGKSLTIRFGRAGTAGQAQTKVFGSEAEAERACAKLMTEKRAKGYRDGRPDQPAPVAAGKALDLTQVTVRGGPLTLTTNAEVDAVEAQLGVSFPRGYREYLTTLGEGVLGMVRVYPPGRVARDLEKWRDRINRYWFWDAGGPVLSKPRALESIVIADTGGGDEIIFHPDEPDRLLVLPIDSEQIFVAGADLLEAVEWICSSGKVTRRLPKRVFEPFARSDITVDIRAEVPELLDYVRRRVTEFAGRAAAGERVSQITFGFEFGQGNWVALAFDTRPPAEAEPDGSWSSDVEDFFLERPAWPVWADLPEGARVRFLDLSGKEIDVMLDPDGLICGIIGDALKYVLLTARGQGLFEGLQKANRCEMGVESLEGFYGWPVYEERGQENLV